MKRRYFLGSSIGVFLGWHLPAKAQSNLGPKIHGLTTFKPKLAQAQKIGRTISSSVLSLDLNSGTTKTTELKGYRFGHSLLPLPNNAYFAVPYGDDKSPCLFLDKDFNIEAELYAPPGYGFGGHGVLTGDGKKVFTHFNKQNEANLDPEKIRGKTALIDIKQRKVIRSDLSHILHGHDIILSKDKKIIIVADDGNLSTNSDASNTFGIRSIRPALHLFDARTAVWQRSIPLPINGAVVHLDLGTDGRVFAATEQYVLRNKKGLAVLQSQLRGQTQSYIDSFDPEIFTDELPLPGPLLAINLDNQEIEEYLDIRNQDPFDIKTNQETGNTINVFTSHNRIAKYNASSKSWRYKKTESFNIKEPFGLSDISGSPYMAVNGFSRGIAIFDSNSLDLHRYYDINTHGLKHMVYQAGG